MDDVFGPMFAWHVRHPIRSALRTVRIRARALPHQGPSFLHRTVQRAVRGYDDYDVWAMDHRLTRKLGAMLFELAEIAHGWPGDDAYPEFEDWTAALRKASFALLQYDSRHSIDQINDKVIDEAQEALHWVADNLPRLGD